MHTVSSTYSTIISGPHEAAWKVDINGVPHADIISMEINQEAFSKNASVGSAISADMKLTMVKPTEEIPRMAMVEPFVRITNGVLTSEWLPKGKFFIDTRSENRSNENVQQLTIHAYDAMLKAEQDFPLDALPATDLQVVTLIAGIIGVDLDEYISSQITNGYTVPLSTYSCRELLRHIASAYGGAFIIDDFGHLRLVQLSGYPEETNYLIDGAGFAITFGGDRILV